MHRLLRVELKEIEFVAEKMARGFLQYVDEIETHNRITKENELPNQEKMEAPVNPKEKSRFQNWRAFKAAKNSYLTNLKHPDLSVYKISSEELEFAKNSKEFKGYAPNFQNEIIRKANERAEQFGVDIKEYKKQLIKAYKVQQSAKNKADKERAKKDRENEYINSLEGQKKEAYLAKKQEELERKEAKEDLIREQETIDRNNLKALEKKYKEDQIIYHKQDKLDYQEHSISNWINVSYMKLHVDFKNSQTEDPLLEDDREEVKVENKQNAMKMLALYKAALKVDSSRSFWSKAFNWVEDYRNSKAIGVIERSLKEDFGFSKKELKNVKKFLISDDPKKYGGLKEFNSKGEKKLTNNANNLHRLSIDEVSKDEFGKDYIYKNDKRLDKESKELQERMKEHSEDLIEQEKQDNITLKEHLENINEQEEQEAEKEDDLVF